MRVMEGAGAPAVFAVFDGRVRSTPIREPRKKAITQEQSAVVIVHMSPESSMSRYVPVPSGEASKKIRQFQL